MEDLLSNLGDVFVGVVSGGVLVALITLFVQRDTRAAAATLVKANAEGRRVEAADQVISRLITQCDNAMVRIDHLENELNTERQERRISETNLRSRVHTLENLIRRSGMEVPPEYPPPGAIGI